MRGKIGLHYGLQRCNAATCRPGCVGEGSREYRPPIVGNTAADCREYCCRLSGILLPIVGVPAAVRGDAWNESC